MEFSRVAKNVAQSVASPSDHWALEHVLPEVPIGQGKADLVLAGKNYGRTAILLVVEFKQRPLTTFGPSYASAARQAWHYAEKVGSRFYAVYDGWVLLLFQTYPPYLIGVYNAELDKELTDSMLREFLLGLMEYISRNQSQRFNGLPRPRDPVLLKRRVLPSIAKAFAKAEKERNPERQIDIEKRSIELLQLWTNVLG